MKKIMIIDDDVDIGILLKAKLEASSRFSVVTAVGGREGIAMAQTEHPDLILCDVDMPDVDGGQVAQAISTGKATRGIPIIMLTSLFSAEEAGQISKTGRLPVVSKQSPVPELVKKIDEVLA